MSCYAGIKKFQQETLIETDVYAGRWPSGVNNFTHNPKIALYTHTAKQKLASFTLIALAIITVIVGVYLKNPAASWGMVSAGTGTIIITIGIMTTKHLLFAKQVSRFLVTQRGAQEWSSRANYPEFSPAQHFVHQIDDKTIYGVRYATGGMKEYRIEFHAMQRMR